ncbi:hypothetical protein C8Q70DRAFT_1009106 [Cubamyces menziesii]|nr:hypothetical protein C8Q70DRAFT_1009106 [Cubamyces menziesii]
MESHYDCTELSEDLERELRGKIQYNNCDLLSELLGPAAEGHITQRSRPITGGVDPMTQEDRVKLIVASILENLPDELETLKTVANGARASLPPAEQERLMYEPLEAIFQHIQENVSEICASSGITPYTAGRRFVRASEKTLKSDDHQRNDNQEKPDFLLANSGGVRNMPWRACSAFFEIKADESDGPTPRNGRFDTTVTQTLRQGAEFARLIFSSRPHHLHVWGLFLCGNKLTLGRFDRRGVVLSQEYDLQNPEYIAKLEDPEGSDDAGDLEGAEDANDKNLGFSLKSTKSLPRKVASIANLKTKKNTKGMKTRKDMKTSTSIKNAGKHSKTKRTAENEPDLVRFVRIVVCLTYEMSTVELGHDPTVTTFGTCTYLGSQYPSFKIRVGEGPVATSWVTISQPIGASLSLFGRGTSVWYVIPETEATNSKISRPTVYILKNAWRPASRLGEYLIYTRMLTHAEVAATSAIARPLAGGDVEGNLRGGVVDESLTISIGAIRHSHSASSSLEVDAVLHRMVLKDYGLPLHKFRTILEMLRAVRAVVKGHRVLARAGILHRNISPGNIMIRLSNPQVKRDQFGKLSLEHSQPEGPTQSAGFLMDFEFASLPNGEDRVGQSSDINSLPKDGMTGQGLFMATEVLISVARDIAIIHTASHDLQSVLWAILYAIYRNAHTKLDDDILSRNTKTRLSTIKDGLKKEYSLLFSASSVEDLLASRAAAFGTCVSAARVHTEATCGGVQYLLMYADMFLDEDITEFLEAVWILLRQCQPVFVPTEKHQYADIYSWKLESANASGAHADGRMASTGQGASSPFWRMSDFALKFNHDILEKLLDRVLEKIEKTGSEHSDAAEDEGGSEYGDGDRDDVPRQDEEGDGDEDEDDHQDREEGGDADGLTDRLGAPHLAS